MPLTDNQKNMCAKILESHWDGPKPFAQNILNQDWCSPKQEQALRNIRSGTRPWKSNGYVHKSQSSCPLNYLDHDELTDFTGWQGEF